MKKLMIIALIMAVLSPLAGCTSTQNTDSSSSSYEKSKADYEKRREGSGRY